MAVIMVCGFPASGKSSLTESLMGPEVIVLNRDTMGGTIAQLLPKLESHLKNKDDIILDNLFPTTEIRKPFIDLCKKYNTSICCKWMDTSMEEAQFNAVQRMISITGKFLTLEEIKKSNHPNIFPPVVLFRYKKEFQAPQISEGFEKIDIIKFSRKDNPTFINKAIIVDYDGTIRECVGGNGKYPTHIDHVVIKNNCHKVLQSYKDKGYLLLGVSNQSGVHKGELSYDTCKNLFEYTNDRLGLDIEYKFCPHQSAPISCYCRKPSVGFGVEFIMKHQLDRKSCIMVGDMTTDKTFSNRCGFQYVDQSEFFK